MKEIILSNGKIVFVDDNDYKYLSQFKWHYSCGYAARWIKDNSIGGAGGSGRSRLFMHRELINPPKNMQIDHINCNRLDNQKNNLRICTIAQNSKNNKIRKNNTSGIKGVSLYKSSNKWMAKITVNKKEIYLGLFININDAKEAYKRASIKYHGEFGRFV